MKGSRATLCGLWEYLAGLAGDASGRRRLLIAAVHTDAGRRQWPSSLARLEFMQDRESLQSLSNHRIPT
jgi:hypothetical protein